MSTVITDIDSDRQPQFMHNVLSEQLKWLIKLRWFAILGIVTSNAYRYIMGCVITVCSENGFQAQGDTAC